MLSKTAIKLLAVGGVAVIVGYCWEFMLRRRLVQKQSAESVFSHQIWRVSLELLERSAIGR